MKAFLRTELKMPYSSVTLGYISNDSKKFQVFVANRVAVVQQHSEPSQWKHIGGQENPAEAASRGMTAHDFLHCSRWLLGPRILWSPEHAVPDQEPRVLDSEDPELKKSVVAHDIQAKPEHLEFSKFSSWRKLIRMIDKCLEFAARAKKTPADPLLNRLNKAEKAVIRAAQ